MTFALPGAITFGDVTYESRVERTFALIVEEHDATSKIAPVERGPYLAIEQRLQRVMQHITLKDMLRRLEPPGPR